jgi:hypothetical protein
LIGSGRHERKAYRIADNKTADLSDWNYELLPIELADLQGKEYDLSLLGFNEDELAELLGSGIKDGLCDPDDVPMAPDEATTRAGDLWILATQASAFPPFCSFISWLFPVRERDFSFSLPPAITPAHEPDD